MPVDWTAYQVCTALAHEHDLASCHASTGSGVQSKKSCGTPPVAFKGLEGGEVIIGAGLELLGVGDDVELAYLPEGLLLAITITA